MAAALALPSAGPVVQRQHFLAHLLNADFSMTHFSIAPASMNPVLVIRALVIHSLAAHFSTAHFLMARCCWTLEPAHP
jgi:hypothetical protein